MEKFLNLFEFIKEQSKYCDPNTYGIFEWMDMWEQYLDYYFDHNEIEG